MLLVSDPENVRGGAWCLGKLDKADWQEVEQASEKTDYAQLRQLASSQMRSREGYSLLANHLNCVAFGSKNEVDPADGSHDGALLLSLVRPVPANRTGTRKSGASGWTAYRGKASPGTKKWPSGWVASNAARRKAKSAKGRAKAKARA